MCLCNIADVKTFTIAPILEGKVHLKTTLNNIKLKQNFQSGRVKSIPQFLISEITVLLFLHFTLLNDTNKKCKPPHIHCNQSRLEFNLQPMHHRERLHLENNWDVTSVPKYFKRRSVEFAPAESILNKKERKKKNKSGCMNSFPKKTLRESRKAFKKSSLQHGQKCGGFFY